MALTTVTCEDSSGPRSGFARLFVVPAGDDLDFDYEITSDTIKVPLVANARVVLQLPSGPRSFELRNVSNNCIIDGSNIISVEVPRNDTVDVQFKVGCAQTGITIETITTGLGIPAGFQAFMPPGPPTPVLANGTINISRLNPGSYQVRLSRMSSTHCAATGDSIIAANVVNRQMTKVTFNMHCILPPLTGVFVFVDYTAARMMVIGSDGVIQGDLGRGWTPSWSRDGTKIVFSSTECDYYSYSCTGALGIVDPSTRITTMLPQAALGATPDWSPVEDVIVYSNASNGALLVYTVATAASTAIPLPANTFTVHPSWSPDGKQIAATCYGFSASQICVMNRDGSNFNVISNVPQGVWNPSWSPDGRQILYSTYTSGQAIVGVMNADGTGSRTLANGWAGAWSPDGKQIVFGSQNGLFIINEDGSTLRRLSTGNHDTPDWRAGNQ